MEEKEGAVIAYFSPERFGRSFRIRLAHYLGSLRELGFKAGKPVIRRLRARDWGREWRIRFKPVMAGSSVRIRPPWEKPASGVPADVVIMPRMAFGTGTHETTRLCIRMMEKALFPESRILDIGTGSGILAITAARWKGARVVGCDTDPVALENARENVRLNQVEKDVLLFCGSLDALKPVPFSVILANIQADTITALLPGMGVRCAKGGCLILSGILEEDRPAVEKALAKEGYALECVEKEGEWLGMRARLRGTLKTG